jgi:hypothetical protein
MSTWLPLLVTLVAGICGLVGYAWQKSVDRRNALIELRRKEYPALLEQLVRAFSSPDALSELNVTRMRFAVIASDEVLRQLSELAKHTVETEGLRKLGSRRKFKEILATLIVEMRRDCFERTKLESGEMSAFLPIEDK